MMQASFEGKSVWKTGVLSLLSPAASYGIGEIFKGAAATFGKELLRAGSPRLGSVGVVPGTIVGGAIGGVVGTFGGGWLGTRTVDIIYGM